MCTKRRRPIVIVSIRARSRSPTTVEVLMLSSNLRGASSLRTGGLRFTTCFGPSPSGYAPSCGCR